MAIFEYLHIFVIDTTPAVWVLLIVELLVLRKRRDLFGWTMAIFPFAFMLLLACSTKTNDRYFLPATGGFYYLAGLGVMDLPELLPTPALAAAAVALALNIVNYPVGLMSYVTAFAHDDRSEMLEWIRANVPASAVIAGEGRADLPQPRRPERLAVQPLLPQRVVETKYAADLGATPQAVAAGGIQYVVVSESDYGVFFRKAAAGHLSQELQRKREFHVALFRDYKPVWVRRRGTGIYLHPGLEVYPVGG